MNINLERKKERKQKILIVLGLFVLIGMIGGLTFAFFNFMFSFILCSVLISNPNKIRELEEKN